MTTLQDLRPSDHFDRRHIGPSDDDIRLMLDRLSLASLDALVDEAVPRQIRSTDLMDLPAPLGESATFAHLKGLAKKNRVVRSLIGAGYYDTIVPPVVQRNVLESPGWYTQYTPYQAEIAQGRLEALLNFQTMVADLTGLPIANASLLDEGTAAAEAMGMAFASSRQKRPRFFCARDCHPQTIAVVQTRAEPLGIDVVVGDPDDAPEDLSAYCGALLAYPSTDGRIRDLRSVIARCKESDAVVVMVADLLALTLITPPGELGADIAVGSTQRFGVPVGFGGPHAAFMATTEKFTRQIPGRIIGLSRDADGHPAYRLAIQTREQHIRRDKATSNICTSQVLLAIMASFYAVYHGPEGLSRIARRVHGLTNCLARGLDVEGYKVRPGLRFDTVTIDDADSAALAARALAAGFNIRTLDAQTSSISLDERSTVEEVDALLAALTNSATPPLVANLVPSADISFPAPWARTSPYLQHPVFHSYHSEHEILRYIHRLQSRDLSLTTSMIPLGSCTMKLNATTEMLPVTWEEFGALHPFAPADQTKGYQELFARLERMLAVITGFSAVSLQPNAGSQGEYTGLLVIRAYHRARGDHHRDVCLIPVSAHGTNPASAVMCGMKVVPIRCDDEGNIDVADLRLRAAEHKDRLAALMITYPSTHGVFEESVREVCELIHASGGQVYMDGANMNAQVGLVRPGEIGADVCHLNLHKTFCIPHGGGGPGMGPICVAAHLAPFLPGHPLTSGDNPNAIGPVSAAPYGSPSILPISYAYIAMMGAEGLTRATQIAILNANYMAARLAGHFDILFTGKNGRVAHEFIIDVRPFKASAGVETDDIAKRLMDYGFHAPTMSWPVPGTLMIEPTESETLAELDRFCDAMIGIRQEIQEIIDGRADRVDNVLKNAPHPARALLSDVWDRPYAREKAAYPTPWTRAHKFWPPVARVDNAYGDRNLMCTCPPMDAYTTEAS